MSLIADKHCDGFQLPMNVSEKMMNFVVKLMVFLLEMMNVSEKMMNFVVKLMVFVLEMMNFENS